MDKPKLLVLTSSYPGHVGDSSGSFVHQLSKRLTESFDVVVLTPYSPNAPSTEKMDGVHVVRYRYWPTQTLISNGEIMANLKLSPWMVIQVIPFLLGMTVSAMRLIHRHEIRLVHAHWLIPQGLVAAVCTWLYPSVRVLGTVHGGDYNGFSRGLKRRLLRWSVNSMDRITVVSHALRRGIEEVAPGLRSEVMPMGIDTQLFHPDKRDNGLKDRLNANGPLFLFVGGLVQRKGIIELIEAMPHVLTLRPEVHLAIIGPGPLRDRMEQRCHELGISSAVTFLGAIPNRELPPYFASADIFILPSHSEGFGLVYAEALSSGTLAIAADLPPVHDIIADNETGFFLEDHRPETIANKLIEVLHRNAAHASIKERGRQHVVANFDWTTVATKYSELLTNLYCRT